MIKERVVAICFKSVYNTRGCEKILYCLLKERPRSMNISHQRMPLFSEHRRFVRSKPYKEWYFITKQKNIIGSIYLSYLNEIGIFLFKQFRGKGLEEQVLQNFIASRRRLRLLANISLNNRLYMKLFRSLGFRHIQNTYCLKPTRDK